MRAGARAGERACREVAGAIYCDARNECKMFLPSRDTRFAQFRYIIPAMRFFQPFTSLSYCFRAPLLAIQFSFSMPFQARPGGDMSYPAFTLDRLACGEGV